jgi:hypothetical protein
MHKLNGIFPLPVLETKIDNWESCKEEIFSKIKTETIHLDNKKDSFILASNSFISQEILNSCPIIKYTIESYLNIYAEEINVSKLTITNSWISSYRYNEYIAPHHHLPKHVSGVMFLNDGFEGGDFYFDNPSVDMDNLLLFEKYSKLNQYTEPVHIVKPEAGKLIIFKAFMYHGTTPLITDTTRYTLAFNAMVSE